MSQRFPQFVNAPLLFSALLLIGGFAPAWADDIEATMTVDLLDRTAISSSVDGVLELVAARAGDPIQQGQVLVQVATERRERELAAAKADYLALSQRAANNTQELVNALRERSARFNVAKLDEASKVYRVSVPALERVRAESELEQAATEKEGARKELRQFAAEAEARLMETRVLELDIEKSRITSPYDGAFFRVDKQAGEYVQQGETIAELYRLDRLTGVVLISREKLPPENAVGVSGRFVVAAAGSEESYPITIVRVIPRVDVDGLYRAIVELDNTKAEDGRWCLLPGIAGRAVFDR